MYSQDRGDLLKGPASGLCGCRVAHGGNPKSDPKRMQGQQLVVFGGERSDPGATGRAGGAAPEQAAGEEDEEEPDEEPVEPIADVCALDAVAHFWVSLPMDGGHPFCTAALARLLRLAVGGYSCSCLGCSIPNLSACDRKQCTIKRHMERLWSAHMHVVMLVQCACAGMDGCKQVPARAGPSLTALPDGRGLVFGAHCVLQVCLPARKPCCTCGSLTLHQAVLHMQPRAFHCLALHVRARCVGCSAATQYYFRMLF